MSRHYEFEMLAERVLLTLAGKEPSYTPPENAHMIVDTALAITKDFFDKLHKRREELDSLDGLLPTEIDLLRSNQKIMAIKSVRERTGMNLKQAKMFVDQEAHQLDLPPKGN